MKKRAFISVFDKTGVVDFAKELISEGYEILSTGGTQKTLEEAGLTVINVSDITGFKECLDGRVKTLHPRIHAGILAIRDNEEHMKHLEELDINTIDIVVVNLYPFKATISKENVTLEEAIENIDIGGPTMLRAAAKNWQDVTVVCDYKDYGKVIAEIKNGGVFKNTKFALAVKVFENTAAYDSLIFQYLYRKTNNTELPDKLTLTFEKQQNMRYGENPHQSAAFYKEPLKVEGSLANATQLNGKELSYNNINDVEGALELIREFKEITVVAVKHANPCGVGCAENLHDAYLKAYECDSVSIFGGIVATNVQLDEVTAREMSKTFLEIIIAPSYSPRALSILKEKKNLRVLELKELESNTFIKAYDFKRVLGGLLIQDYNTCVYKDYFKVVTKKAPTDEQIKDLEFAFKAVKHVKSNGIVVVKNQATTGIGPGQVNRIWATEMALERSGDKAKGAVMASDAFFPFDDCVDAAAKAGITAIIQPGGSVRDEDSIKKCDEYGIAMVFTDTRHFKH